MSFTLANMEINRIILHKIHQRRSSDIVEIPTYNDSLTQLDLDAMCTFKERVVQALGSDSNSVEMDITEVSQDSTFDYIKRSIVANEQDFIELSKKTALKLASSQKTLKIPGGIFIMFDGTIGLNNNRFLAIMKAETQEGFTLKTDDNSPLTLSHLRELFLTPQQKLYKIGIFIEVDNNYKAIIYDKNLSKGRKSEAAKYFYEGFLGCSQNSNSKVLTKKFYTETQDFINKNKDITPNEKLRLNNALNTYLLGSRQNIISCNEFSDLYLDDEYKDNYTNHMESCDIPQTTIIKDTSSIESIMKNRKIFFKNNIKLVGPSDKFEDVVSVEINDTETIIRIRDVIVGQE